MADEPVLAATVVVAFGLPLVYLSFVRRIETFGREPRRWLLAAFALGALIPALFGFLVIGELIDVQRALRVLLIAPVVEEILKGLAVAAFRRRVTEPLDGIVYGAAVGLGFAAVETTLYGIQQWQANNVDGAILVALGRAFTTSVMHAITTALVGYGWVVAWSQSHGWWGLAGFFLLAVGIHVAYNLGAISFDGPTQAAVFYTALVAASITALPFMVRWVRRSDRREGDTV